MDYTDIESKTEKIISNLYELNNSISKIKKKCLILTEFTTIYKKIKF